jgi:hypothetical protein
VTKKKRRKRPGPLRPAEGSDAATGAITGDGGNGAGGQRRDASRTRPRSPRPSAPVRRPRTTAERREAAAHWVHPPLAFSLARGLFTVGESPPLVVSALLAPLVLWLIFTAYGAHLARFPGLMAMLVALPPVHSLFLDISALVGGSSNSTLLGLLFLTAVLAVRAGLLAFWVNAILDRLEPPSPVERGVDPAGGWRGALTGLLGRSARVFGAMLGMEAAFFAFSLLTAFIAVAVALGQFAVIAALVGGVYFFAYTPVIIAVDGVSVREAARLSFRAARFPGPRHMVATFSYLVLALFVAVFVPPSRVAAATPDLATWLFVLFMSFVHVAALATLTYRWLLIRERVLEAARSAQPRRVLRAPASSR